MQVEFGVLSNSFWGKLRAYSIIYSRGFAHALGMCWHHLAISPVLTYVFHNSLNVETYVALTGGLLVTLFVVLVAMGTAVHVSVNSLIGAGQEMEHTRRMAVMTVKHIQELTQHIPSVEAVMEQDKDMGPLWKLAREMKFGCGNPNCDCGKMNGKILHPKSEPAETETNAQ